MVYQVRFAFWWFTLAAVGRGAILFIFLWHLLAQLISGLPFLFPFITPPSSLQLEGLELCGQGREGPFAAPGHWGWRVLVSPGPKRTLKGKGWGGHWNLKPPTPENGHQILALGTSEPYSPNPARDPARLRVLRAAWELWWWPGPGPSHCAMAPVVLWHSTTRTAPDTCSGLGGAVFWVEEALVTQLTRCHSHPHSDHFYWGFKSQIKGNFLLDPLVFLRIGINLWYSSSLFF